MKKKKTIARSPAKLSILDDLLKEDSKLDEFQAVAIKEVYATRQTEDDDLARRRIARNGPRLTLKSLEADLAKRTAKGQIKPKPPMCRGRTRSKSR